MLEQKRQLRTQMLFLCKTLVNITAELKSAVLFDNTSRAKELQGDYHTTRFELDVINLQLSQYS